MIKIENPLWLLVAVLLVPAVIWLFRWGWRKRREVLSRVASERLLDRLLGSVDMANRRWKRVILLAGIVLALAAASRPMIGEKEVRVELPGIDYFVCVDVSRSMLAEDAKVEKGFGPLKEVVTTNRLAAAKDAIDRLVKRPSGNRIGLIAFAGEAYLISPITQDHYALQRSLRAITPRSVTRLGTDLALAIRLADRSFEEKQEAGKAIIMVSDGEELKGDAVLAAREAALHGVSVFVAGVGSTTGAKVPKDRSSKDLLKDEFDREVVSRVNERVLKQVAVAGRGYYEPVGDDLNGLVDIYDTFMSRLPRAAFLRKSKDKRELFQIPLAACIGLVLWEMLVSERKKAGPPSSGAGRQKP